MVRLLLINDGKRSTVINPFVNNNIDHTFEPWYIAGHKLSIKSGNLIKIPPRVFKEAGYKRSDGTYAMVIETGNTHIEGKHFQGADVLKGKKIMQYARKSESGRVPDSVVSEAAEDDLRILKPKDGVDLYVG